MTARLFSALALLAVACSPAHASEPPEGAPLLCDIDGGAWCVDCDASGSVCRPGQQAAGFLCCVGQWCVPMEPGDECLGISGWCEDYYTAKTKAGNEYAVCEG